MENVIFINFDRNFMPQPRAQRKVRQGKKRARRELSAQGCASWKFPWIVRGAEVREKGACPFQNFKIPFVFNYRCTWNLQAGR